MRCRLRGGGESRAESVHVRAGDGSSALCLAFSNLLAVHNKLLREDTCTNKLHQTFEWGDAETQMITLYRFREVEVSDFGSVDKTLGVVCPLLTGCALADYGPIWQDSSLALALTYAEEPCQTFFLEEPFFSKKERSWSRFGGATKTALAPPSKGAMPNNP